MTPRLRPSSSWPAACVRRRRAIDVARVYERPGPARLRLGPASGWGRTSTIEPTGPHAAPAAISPARAAAGHRGAAPARSRRSTRFRRWPWRQRWPRAPRCSPTSGELRVKEVDRLAAVAAMVEAFGARATVDGRHAGHHGTRGPAAGRPVRQPGRPPHGHGRRRGRARPPRRASAACSPDSVRSRPATPTFAEDLAPARRRDRRAPGRCSWPSTGRPGRASRPCRRRWRERLGVDRLDTGAMYRAVAALALERGIAPDDTDAVAALAAAATIEVGRAGDHRRPRRHRTHPLARGRAGPSRVVAANPQVRRHLVRAPAGLGPRPTAEASSRAVTSARSSSRRPSSRSSSRHRPRSGPGAATTRRPRVWPGVTGSTRPGTPRRYARPTTPTGSIRPAARVQDVVEEVLSWL